MRLLLFVAWPSCAHGERKREIEKGPQTRTYVPYSTVVVVVVVVVVLLIRDYRIEGSAYLVLSS